MRHPWRIKQRTRQVVNMNNVAISLYSITCALILLHEIESAFEREWEILRLPGKINGFLLIHIPILALMFWGFIENPKTTWGCIISIIIGIGGLLPVLVHKVIVKNSERFNRVLSNIIMYCSGISGLALICVSIIQLQKIL